MRLLLVSLMFSFIIPAIGHAQEQGKTYYGINYSPDIAYRRLNVSNSDTILAWILDFRNNTERPIIAYSGGLTIEHHFVNAFTLTSGIQFYQMGEGSTTTFSSFGGNVQTLKFIYTYNYIGVPVQLGYRIPLSDGLDFTLGLGGSVNAFLFTINRYSIRENGQVTDRGSSMNTNGLGVNFERFNFMGTVSAGFDYKVTDKLKFALTPTFRYGFNSIIDAPIKQYPFAVGLNIGLKFSPNGHL